MQILRRWRWHIIFWLAYFVGWSWFSLSSYHEAVWLAVAVTGCWFAGQAPLVYVIVYRWVPHLFRPRRIWRLVSYMLAGLVASAAFIAISCNALLTTFFKGYQVSVWTYFSFTLLGNTYWSFLALAITIIRDRLRNERWQQRMEKEKVDGELRFLRAQMNPHFLFNALNSIYVLIRKDPDLAEHTLAEFSEMLRYQLYECAVDRIPIEKEMAYLENYVRLERLRKGDSLQVVYINELGGHSFCVAPLLIMPLVENAFKYVSSADGAGNRVSIRIAFEQPLFCVYIANTVGPVPVIPPAASALQNGSAVPGNAGGIGLENLKKRLALLYPDRNSLEVRPGAEAFEVTLKLDIE